MGNWIRISEGSMQPDTLCIYYMPHARYIWGCAKDRDDILKQYPEVTHWIQVMEAPSV